MKLALRRTLRGSKLYSTKHGLIFMVGPCFYKLYSAITRNHYNMKTKSITLFSLIILVCSFSLLSFKPQTFDLKASIARGKEIYIASCISCHMDEGQGLEGVYPPLAKADYLMADKKRSIQQVLYGASGEMKVNGKIYNMEMTGFELKDDEVSDVLNYIRNSFGNKGAAITAAEVKAARK